MPVRRKVQMKQLLLTASMLYIGVMLSSCAHERTEMDRELALKLADRPQVQVIQSPPAHVNVTVNNNGSSQPNYQSAVPSDDYYNHVHYVPSGFAAPDTSQAKKRPQYDIYGNVSGYVDSPY